MGLLDVDPPSFALKYAEGLGAEYAEARLHSSREVSCLLRNGLPEPSVISDAKGLGIRILYGGALAFAATNDLTKDNVKRLVEGAVKGARASSPLIKEKLRFSEEGAHRGKWRAEEREELEDAGTDRMLGLLQELDSLIRGGIQGLSFPNRLLVISKAVEEKLYVNSEGAWLEGRVPRVDFHSYITVVHGGGTTAITVPAGYSQLGGSGGWEAVEVLDLHAYFPEEVKKLAGVVRDAVKPSEGIMDVILGPQVVGLIAHESVGHPGEADRVLGREAAQAGESYIKPQDLGLKVGCEEAHVSDDPGIPHSSGFYLYDDEGVPARKKRLMEAGVVRELLHNRSTAYRFGISSNGSSRASGYDREPIVRMSNTFVEPGDYSLNELVEGIELGIYIKSFMEWNIDDRRVNQRYVGLEAYRIEGGEVRGAVRSPVLEVTTNKLWGSLDARGKDLSFTAATCGKGDPQQGIPVWAGGPHIRLRSVRVGSR